MRNLLSARDLITDYRAKNGYTQDEMAKQLGISRVTLLSIEQGKQLSVLTRGKVAKFFNENVNEIN